MSGGRQTVTRAEVVALVADLIDADAQVYVGPEGALGRSTGEDADADL